MELLLKIPVSITYDLELLPNNTLLWIFFFLPKNYTEQNTHLLLINLHT